MKKLLHLFIFLSPIIGISQNHIPISIHNMYYNGKPFYTSISQLPQTDSIINPHYECGKFSEEQGKTFLQYHYDNMNYITYDSISEINQIIFQEGDVLEIEGKKITANMNISKIAYLLGVQLPVHRVHNIIIIAKEDIDEQLILHFDHGKLIKLTRWSPC